MAEVIESTKMIRLIGSDGVEVLLPRNAAQLSEFINHALSLDEEEEEPEEYKPVECKRVASKTLEAIVQFLTYNKDIRMKDVADPRECPIPDTFEKTVPQKWYRDFVTGLGLDMLWRVRSAANFMGIEQLVYLTNVWLAFYLLDKSVDQMHEILRIPHMTAKEEEKARKEHPWLFEQFEEDDDEAENVDAPAPAADSEASEQ